MCGQEVNNVNKVKMSVTYQPKKRKRAKTHGFLKRSKSKTGKNVLKARRQKGRKKISV
jgi:large subunit ribosomal protein L34